MSNTKHTPGPWVVNEDTDFLWVEPEASLCNAICDIVARKNSNYDHPDFQGEDYANARLIAAAPELLEAAKDVCGLLFSLENVPDDHPAYQALKEAIKKAQP